MESNQVPSPSCRRSSTPSTKTSLKQRLFRWICTAGVVLLATQMHAWAGFTISGTELVDGKGNVFILRGINHPHCWYTSTTQKALQDIAAKKANSVRVVMSTGAQWTQTTAADVAQIIQWCKDNKLVAVLEVHDCTGYGDTQYSPNAVPMSQAVDYWISIASALQGQEDYVILNIANEPLGNNLTSSNWVSDSKDAVTRLRAAQFKHTIMVDCGNWGQDWTHTSLDNASQVWAVDNLKNLLFSVHMYQVYLDYSTIDTYLSSFIAKGMPLVVGEFGSSNGPGVYVDAADIMERCDTRQIGYMGWSWCGNNSTYSALDIVTNFDPTQVTTWGDMLINSTHGIAATSKTCTIYDTTLSVSPTTATIQSTGGSATIAVTSSAAWTASSNQTWLTVSPTSGSASGSLTITASANSGTASRSATVTVTSGSLTQTVAVTQLAPSGQGPATVTTGTSDITNQWYLEEDVKLSSTASITALNLTVNLAKTSGARYSGMYNTLGGSIVMGHSDTGSILVYTFSLQPGATLNPGSSQFATQMGLSGTAHATTGDTWTLTYTSGGTTYTKSGGF